MKYCPKCKVNIQGPLSYCPLCQTELLRKEEQPEEELFPNTYNLYASKHMVLRTLGFLSLTVAILSFAINFLFITSFCWSFIVITIIGGIWISIGVAISKHRNILKYLFYQSLIICLFALFIDYLTGSTGWSIDFVLPIIFTCAMTIMYLLTKILHLQAGDYIIYLLLDALFGIVPLLFITLNWVDYQLPSILCILVSIISLSALVIFEGKTIYEELHRRLHV